MPRLAALRTGMPHGRVTPANPGGGPQLLAIGANPLNTPASPIASPRKVGTRWALPPKTWRSY
jgi:hypothetical protein